jgi:hypothetical protein
MKTPEFKQFSYEVMAGTKPMEVIQLLAQVMESYKHLNEQEMKAVAQWFHDNYKPL